MVSAAQRESVVAEHYEGGGTKMAVELALGSKKMAFVIPSFCQIVSSDLLITACVARSG